MQYFSTLKAKLIYIFSINDAAHRGCIKIGEATLDEATNLTLAPNCKELNNAARKRIDQYTKTAGIQYTLHYTELTISIRGGVLSSFNDKAVHEVLLRSGIKRHDFSQKNQGREWFECSVETAIKAIQAVKDGRSAISSSEIVPIEEEIEFRPEQQEAITKTVNKYQSGGKIMLWNAKMRFGKTLSALQVVKECEFHRTIIITHRPVVDKGWFEDFGKIFKESDGYRYGSREKGFKYEELEFEASMNPERHYVYFASMQDLRGAQMAGGKFDKNEGIFAANYDMLIVDEAHEGTQTELGQNVIKLLSKNNTHVLNLSGTPFNLLEDYSEDEIFTWDYVMEQKAKAEWDINHFGDPNPYAGLPRLNIFTFDLGKVLSGFADTEDYAFNFKEFFRTWTGDKERDHRDMPEGMEGRFIHEEHVKNFLDLIVKYDPETNYPFSTVEFRNSFRHTLWMVPGVREAKALSALLQQHTIFGQFNIVNVAGEGDDDVPYDDALKLVEQAMGNNPEDTRTITLSCGKLTTGVSVKPWTAVMMLAGSHNTDAKAYMQTIFRVQTPYTTKDGRRKENCYVFDFAPDRTLKVLADTAKVSHKKTTSDGERIKLGEFLNFCPVIGYNGTKMAAYNVDSMLEQLKRAYISRVTKNGCDDPRLYNMEMLRKLDKDALAKFQNLHRIIGATKANPAAKDIDMAKSGLTNEQYEQLEKLKKKQKRELTPEELQQLEEAKEKKKNAENAISILRGISIRLPLLMYGAELADENQDITLENFAELIDNQSWEEFMPRGVTKELFKEFVPYYDPDMFRAVGRNYRDLVRQADQLPPMERVKAVSRIFSYFRNPDKETVLTPWRVVNMHIGDCIGGYVFFDEAMETESVKPRLVDHGAVTAKVFKEKNTRILEINSKTGLYPLYMAYGVFAEKLQDYRDHHMLATDVPIDIQNQLWDEVLKDNIFVICKTEMAKSITKRTLRGFRHVKVNARYFEDLINKITVQSDMFIKKMHDGVGYWKNDNLGTMNFNAIVGNPPYQIMDGGAQASSMPIYNKFVEISMKLNPSFISMIMPSRWMTGGRGLDDFRATMLGDNHISKLYDYVNANYCFTNVEIKGGICYFLRDASSNGVCENHYFDINNHEYVFERRLDTDLEDNIFIRDSRALSIKSKVQSFNEPSFMGIVSSMKPYGLRGDFFADPAKYGLPPVFDERQNKTDLSILGLGSGQKRVKKYIPEDYPLPSRAGLNDYKIFIPRNFGEGKMGDTPYNIEYAGPNELCTETFVQIFPFKNKVEMENCYSYMKTRVFRLLLGLAKNDQGAAKSVYKFCPIQDFSKPWDDIALYKKYGLTRDEIIYLEDLIKPMDSELLFKTEESVNPKFADFDLIEHGVKVGDKIVYSPTGQELTVAEDNKVEYGGQIMTLSEFTYKNMPDNRISKSGVCKGPKYFTYQGMTLYKLKKTFGK